MRKIVLLLLLVLSFPVFAQIQSGVWGERGISRRFVVRGDLLYSADGRGVSVYDVSDPAAIRRIDVESGDAETRDLAFLGNTDLVVATSAGIDRFSVASDGTLTRLGTTSVDGGVTRVAASSDRVAAAAGTTLLILERTDDALVTDQQRTFGEAIRALAMSGSVAYAAVERTSIFGVDTASASIVATIPVDALGLSVSGSTLWAAADLRGLFAIDLPTSAILSVTGEKTRFVDVAASGARVYAIETPDRVHVYDASRPSEPKRLASLTDWANVIAASGNRLFLAGAIVDSERRTFETGAPLRVYELTGDSLTRIGEVRDLAGPVSGVWTDGSLAYVVDPPYLRVLDVSKTAAPRELASIAVPDIQDHIRVRNGLAVIYGRLHVVLIDVSTPRKPKVLSSWYTQGHAPSSAALLRDTFVEANNFSGLHVVDYTSYPEPAQIAGRIFHYLDVTAADDAIYTIQQATFLTIDLTDRRKVVDRTVYSGQFHQLDTLPPTSAFPHHVALRAGQSIDVYSLIEDRFTPRPVMSAPMDSPGIFGTGEDVVLVSKDGLLYRLDVPGPPQFTPTEMVVTSPMQISVAGEKVVVADRYRLRIYGPDTAPPPAEPVRRRAARH